MAKFRKEYKNGFTTVGNDMYRDKELSLKGRGLLSTMLSLPDNWNFSTMGLATLVSDGEKAVRSGLKELEKLGYLRRNRLTDEKGKVIDWEYIFSDYRMFENPDAYFGHVENVHVDNAHVENGRQLNNNILNTKELNTKVLIDDVIGEIGCASAKQQSRLLEAYSHSEYIVNRIKDTNKAITGAVSSLSDKKLQKLIASDKLATLWEKAFELTDEDSEVENKEGYLVTIIQNIIKGGQK